MNLRELTIHYLHILQQQGVDSLPVDEDARVILRSWMLAAKGRGTPLPVRGHAAVVGAPSVLPQRAVVRLDDIPEPELPSDESRPEDDVPFFRPGGQNPAEAWEAMQRMLPNWKPLRGLGTLRSTPVFGQGNLSADIMFVGDAVNYHDEKAGKPFQGAAGGKLDGMLKAMGLTREQVYITHLVKFRPEQPRQTLNTRPPTEKEIRFSAPVLDFEIGLVQPRVIVALGVIAARGILQRGNLPLAAYQQEHGSYNGIPVVVTHHPSYLLRTSDLSERRRLWEEMLYVMETAGLPISDKQRGYFLPKN
ncbi:MAG: uracil-DNA glycosylase [Akkermansia sp.]|nr:uracil-DNA glycosylase [Akkermansia sp.]MBQ2814796.1 uracil-DNA glycosylase [Akkermansia sp.]